MEALIVMYDLNTSEKRSMPETFCVEGFWGAELRCSRKELFNQVGSSMFKRVKWFFGLAEKPFDPDRLSPEKRY